MTKELTLQVPLSLLSSLDQRARRQGVSLEAFCLSLLDEDPTEEETLVDPSFYSSLSHSAMRDELKKVIESTLPKEEMRKRINNLEFQLSRRYIR